jgi:hypothetical protein
MPQLMTPFTWSVAKSYLVDTLGKIIRSIIDGPVMDLRAAAGGDALQLQVQMLGETCRQVVQYRLVLAVIKLKPLQYRQVFAVIKLKPFHPDNRVSVPDRAPNACFHPSTRLNASSIC